MTLSCLLLALAAGPAAAQTTPQPVPVPFAEELALNQEAENFFKAWFVDRDAAGAAARHVSKRLDDKALVPGAWIEDYKGEPMPSSNAEIVAGWVQYLDELLPERPAKTPAQPRSLARLIFPLSAQESAAYARKNRGMAGIGERLLSFRVRKAEQLLQSDAPGLAVRLQESVEKGADLRAVVALFRTGRSTISFQPVVSYWAREPEGWKLWGIAVVPVM